MDISLEKTIIAEYERGEDVRDAFIDACKKIADEKLPLVQSVDVDKVLTVNSLGKWGVDSWI